jgi:acyl carrier protein
MTADINVLQLLYDSVDEINQELPHDRQLQKTPDTILYGQSGSLDSLGLVHLIVAIEQNLEEAFAKTIILADEKAMSQQRSPFRTIGTLGDYVAQLLEELDA